MSKKKASFLNKLRKKYTVVVHNEVTFEEKKSFSVSKLNVLTLFGLLVVVLFITAFLAFSYTPLRLLFPWYNETDYRQTALINQERMDSLEKTIHQYDVYINDLKSVIRGDDFTDSSYYEDSASAMKYENIAFEKSLEDSLLRVKIENESSQQSASFVTQSSDPSGVLFFTPVMGKISQSFNPSKEHYGVDVVGLKDAVIKSVLDGKVIYSGWSNNDGYVIIISHKNGFVSIYKHNSGLLKKSGDSVNSGDAVAIIGNTGNHSSGSHLHFELWLNDKPIDPQEYIGFN